MPSQSFSGTATTEPGDAGSFMIPDVLETTEPCSVGIHFALAPLAGEPGASDVGVDAVAMLLST